MGVENNGVLTVATVSMPIATTSRPTNSGGETSPTKCSLKRPRPESPPKSKSCCETANTNGVDDCSTQKPRSTASPETTTTPSNDSPVGTITPGDSDGSSSSSLTATVTNSDETPPLKSTHFRHLRQKYTSELEYMLREFQKLERQLLGAKGVTTESAGSRERREKLRSFIQHLEDTTQQIQAGCELEAAGKSTCPTTLAAASESTGLSAQLMTREKQEEENVQKLEEHILANLLPVKVRLKKQLAAQQGARQNPAGMPPIRGGGTTTAKAVFLKPRATTTTNKAQQPRSSLTQKLQSRAQHEAAVASAKAAKDLGSRPQQPVAKEKKVMYAGLAPGSSQGKSSVQAASSVHNVVIKNPSLLELQTELHDMTDCHGSMNSLEKAEAFAAAASDELALLSQGEVQLSATAQAAILSYEERRKMRRKKRKRRRMLYQQQAAAAAAAVQPKRKKTIQKAGPRNVEYTCGLCNEVYNSTCECNPWWALTRHECQKCRKLQIPRVDISAPANAIEYHPALLAHADDNSAAAATVPVPEPVVLPPPTPTDPSFHSDLSDDDLLFSDDDVDDDDDSMFSSSPCSDDSDDGAPMTAADQAENENFAEYDGPTLVDDEGCRLLALMLHASTCPCRHSNPEHQEVCRSAKWMMLHVRDCPGTTSTYDTCPFPWCRKVKHLLYHVLSCPDPDECQVCSSAALGPNLSRLDGLNQYRLQAFQKKICHKFGVASHKDTAKLAAAAAGKAAVACSSSSETAPARQSSVAAKNNGAPSPPAGPNTAISPSYAAIGCTVPDHVASKLPDQAETAPLRAGGSENSAPAEHDGPRTSTHLLTPHSSSAMKSEDEALVPGGSRLSLCMKQDRNFSTEPELPSEASIVRPPSLSVIEVSVDP